MSYAQKTLDLLTEGKINDAHAQFELALHSESGDLLYNLAEHLADLGFSNWAQVVYHKLLTDYPAEDELRVRLAELLIADGEDDQALTLLTCIKPSSPAYVAALLTSADLYQTQGMFEVSEQKLLEANKIAPNEEIVQFALAELYFNQKNFSKAKPVFLKLLKDGNITLAGVNLVARLGVCYASMGQFNHALAYLTQIDHSQLDDDSLLALGFTQLQLGNLDAAITHLTQLEKQNAHYTTLYLPLASAYEQQGQLNVALKTAQSGLSQDHYDEKLLLKASQLALKAGQTATAQKYLQQAHEVHPENLAIITQLAQLYNDKHNYETTITLINEAGQSASQDPQLAWLLGHSLWQNGQLDAALPNYQLAATILDNIDFVIDAAEFFRQVGQLSTARKLVKTALKKNPNDFALLELDASLN